MPIGIKNIADVQGYVNFLYRRADEVCSELTPSSEWRLELMKMQIDIAKIEVMAIYEEEKLKQMKELTEVVNLVWTAISRSSEKL